MFHIIKFLAFRKYSHFRCNFDQIWLWLFSILFFIFDHLKKSLFIFSQLIDLILVTLKNKDDLTWLFIMIDSTIYNHLWIDQNDINVNFFVKYHLDLFHRDKNKSCDYDYQRSNAFDFRLMIILRSKSTIYFLLKSVDCHFHLIFFEFHNDMLLIEINLKNDYCLMCLNQIVLNFVELTHELMICFVVIENCEIHLINVMTKMLMLAIQNISNFRLKLLFDYKHIWFWCRNVNLNFFDIVFYQKLLTCYYLCFVNKKVKQIWWLCWNQFENFQIYIIENKYLYSYLSLICQHSMLNSSNLSLISYSMQTNVACRISRLTKYTYKQFIDLKLR